MSENVSALILAGSLGPSVVLLFAILLTLWLTRKSWAPRTSARRYSRGQGDTRQVADTACTEPPEYDYRTAASTFTRLTAACLNDDTLMRNIGIAANYSRAALQYSEGRRAAMGDRYARRSAIYEFADQLDADGRCFAARRLRELSSTLYHGSAAEALHLQPSYSAQFREVVGALHAFSFPELGEDGTISPERALAAVLPFSTAAVPLLTADVIFDIRRSIEFKKYLDALERAGNEVDADLAATRFHQALGDYLAYLERPLALVASEQYGRAKFYQGVARVSKHVSTVGSAAIGMSSSFDPSSSGPLFVLSAVWGFGGWQLSRWLEDRMRRIEVQARREAFRTSTDITAVQLGLLRLGPDRDATGTPG